MERYDIAIIGTGPAGVSAAITATVRNKRVLLLGSARMSDKVGKAHQVDNYPGLPHISGADFAARLKAHLDEMGIAITEKRVGAVYAMGDYYALQLDEDMVEASTVILATGVVSAKSLPGEERFLGRGVSYCATCDARLYRGKTVAVLGSAADAAEEAEFLAQVVEKVLYFPVGKAPEPKEGANLVIVRELPEAVLGEKAVTGLKTREGEHRVDGVFILRDAVQADRLVPGLRMDENHVAVDLMMRTNLPGCFACGDIAGKPYQYVKAAGQGNVAALSAVSYLAETAKAKEE